MPDPVVVGVDGSGPSDAATRWAIERAARLNLDLAFLHASGRDGDGDDASRSVLDRAVMSARSQAGIGRVRGLMVLGDAMEQLITASAEAAIVVVGSHKTGFLRGRVFGSRSLRLVAGALCPVAIIPEASGRTRRGVAVGVADSSAGSRAVRFAATEAAALGEELTLIHGDISTPLGSADRDVDTVSASDRLLAAARRLAIETAPGLAVRVRGLRRPAAVALADAAPTSLLLVLAASSGRSGAAVGRTTHDVLMNLAGPAVVVPA